jgi:hypothetical protein
METVIGVLAATVVLAIGLFLTREKTQPNSRRIDRLAFSAPQRTASTPPKAKQDSDSKFALKDSDSKIAFAITVIIGLAFLFGPVALIALVGLVPAYRNE